MNISEQIANHLRQVFTGGNWTAVNLKEQLDKIDWQKANKKSGDCNTIAALVFHIGYYLKAIRSVLKKEEFNAHDKFSFAVPPINSKQDWDTLLQTTLDDAEELAALIEKFPEEKLSEVFVKEKYGNYLRNFMGLLEHTHYHLGQIVILGKVL